VNHLHAADQMDLFAAPAAVAAGSASTALDATVDQIRERFGNLALRRGSSLPETRGDEESGEDLSEKAPSRAGERAAMRAGRPSDKHDGKPATPPRRTGS
jgi:hypothetical protein